MNVMRNAWNAFGHDTASRVMSITRAVTGIALCSLVVSACVKVIWFM